MKRKFLIFFLTVIFAVCLCIGLSACDLLDGLSDNTQNVEQGSTDDDSEQGSTGDDDSEQSSTGDDDSEQSSTGDDGSEQGSTGDDGSEQDSTGDDGSEQGSTGGEGSEQGSTGDEGSEQGSTGDEGSEQGTTGDEGSEQGSTGDDDSEQGSTGDDGSEQGSTGDDGSEQGTTGDEGSEQGSTGDDGSEQGSTGDDDSEQGSTGDDGSEQGSTGDDDSEQGSTGDDGSEQGSTGDEGSEQGSAGDDDGSEQGSTDDDGSEQGTTDDDSEQGSTGDDGSGYEEEGGETPVDITARAGNSTYGYYQLADETNGAAMQSLYYQMYTACEAFTNDTSDLTKTNGYYSIAVISYGGYSLTTDEAISVWEIFYLENPVYYWLSSTCVYSNSASTLYLCIDEAYASYAERAVYDAEISTMVAEAGALVAQKSTELEKAMAIHDYIIGKINYAYQSDGTTPETAIWAHNITGVSSKGAGVCEAYSKTYLALCLINGLDCIIASGYASANNEAHSWNLVKIDGVWYGVDCTWDDTGDNDDLSYVYFGMNASAINSTRVTGNQTYGMDYLYKLPEVSAYGIQPVTLFKGDTELGTYINIDAAFAAMTDSAADYTIELYFYSSTGTLVYTSPSTTVYIYSEYTPAVNSVTINGVYTDLGSGYFYVSYLNMQSKLTLSCNLEISNIILTATELDLDDYTLTTSGYYCRLNGIIYDSKTTENISIKSATSSRTDVYATLSVSYYYGSASINGTAVIGTYYGSDMLIVYGTATIDKYISANETNYYNIYLQGGATLSVNNLVYNNSGSNKIIYIIILFDSIDEYPALYMGNVEAQTYIFISGNISATEAADPTNLNCAIAKLGSADDFANIRIFFGNINNTYLYSVNSDNEIVYNKE